MAQAAGCNIKTSEEDGVVAQMNEIACGHGACAGADISENHAHADEQANLSPGAPELLRVSQSEERSCGNDARGDAKSARDDGVDAAAENRFLDDGRDKYAQRHQHQDALAAAEEFFHRDAGFTAYEISQPAHNHGQAEATQNVAQHNRAFRTHVAEATPAHRRPEWRRTATSNHNVEKHQCGAGQQSLADDQYGSPIGGRAFQRRGGYSKKDEGTGGDDQSQDPTGDKIKNH